MKMKMTVKNRELLTRSGTASFRMLSLRSTAAKQVLLSLLFMLLCFHHVGNCAEIRDVEVLLEKAYSLRTSKIDLLTDALNELSSLSGKFTAEQRERYDYLRAIESIQKGNIAEAIEGLKAVAFDSHSLKTEFDAKTSLANVLSMGGSREQAFKLAVEVGGPRFSSLTDSEKFRSFVTIAYLFAQSGLYEPSKQLLSRASPDQAQSTADFCFWVAVKSELLFRLGELPDGTDVFKEERVRCMAANESVVTLYVEYLIARNLLELQQPASAEEVFSHKVKLIEDAGYPNLTVNAYAIFSLIKSQLLQVEQATQYADKAVELGQKASHIEGKMLANRAAYEAYKLSGELTKALYYQQRFHEAFKQLVDQQRTSAIAYHTVKLRNEQQEHQLAYLQEQVERLSTERKLANSEKENLALYALLITFSLAGGLGWTYRTRRINATLQRLVKHDALTGVLTRGYATQAMARVLKEQGVLAREASFILVDLDYFKQINDQFGHQAGDWALKQVSKQLSHIARKGDLVGRLGGEEFGILLPSCDLKSANEIAQRIREAFEQIRSEQHPQLEISGSFGVASTRTFGFDFDHLFAAADKALYNAKDDGRNRVVEAALVDA